MAHFSGDDASKLEPVCICILDMDTAGVVITGRPDSYDQLGLSYVLIGGAVPDYVEHTGTKHSQGI